MDTLNRLRTLIGLAAADGQLAEKERHFILSIGLANHLLVSEVLPLFTPEGAPEKIAHPVLDKEQTLLELVQLMKIDEKIYQPEMRYCAQVAARLGFRDAAVFELMLHARELADDPATLKLALKKYQVVQV